MRVRSLFRVRWASSTKADFAGNRPPPRISGGRRLSLQEGGEHAVRLLGMINQPVGHDALAREGKVAVVVRFAGDARGELLEGKAQAPVFARVLEQQRIAGFVHDRFLRGEMRV